LDETKHLFSAIELFVTKTRNANIIFEKIRIIINESVVFL